jgi:hypothetical protein
MSRSSVVLICLGLLAGAPLARAEPELEAPIPETTSASEVGSQAAVLDRRRLDYREDGAGRVVAVVEAVLVRTSEGRAEGRLLISLSDPRVDPLPGYQGVQGVNALAARELRRAVDEQLLEVWAGNCSRSLRRATYQVTQEGPIPERRVGADGRIDLSARTSESFPLQLEILTGVSAYRLVEVRLRGRRRLVASFRVGEDGRGEIVGLMAVSQ